MELRQNNSPLERALEGGGGPSQLANVQLRDNVDNLDDDDAGFHFGQDNSNNNIGGGGMRPQGVDTNRFKRAGGQLEEDERASLVKNSNPLGGKQTTGPSDAQAQRQKVDVTINTIRDPTYPNLSLPPFRSKFPLADRISLSLFGCCGQTLSPRSQLKATEPLFKFDEQYKFDQQGRQALKLKINESGSLVLDSNMVHPFVRVHIINLDTCKYLAKENGSRPGVANIESGCFMDAAKFHTRSSIDYLMPMSTQMFDLRVKGMNLAQWNEEFVINESARYLLTPNVLFLFEILDFNTGMMFESPELLNADHMYPIAWGYLRPVGAAQIHLAKTRLQLYRYKFKYDQEIRKCKSLDPRTPPVFLEFNWPKKEEYPSFLEVELQFTPKSDMIIERKHISRYPWEREIGKVTFEKIWHKPENKDNIIEEPLPKKQKLKRWERLFGLDSELPDKMIYKFDTETLGALKLQFSNSGKYLAVACTTGQKSKTVIKIFDVESGELKVVLSGHHDLIHDLQWSRNDHFLFSSSADCSVKLWNLTTLPDQGDSNKEKLNYTENDYKYFICQLLHPSFVYGGGFYPDTAAESDSRLIVASVCYDQRVRIWLVSLNSFDGKSQGQECVAELNIMEKPLGGGKFANTQGLYDDDILDDAALQMIVNPNNKTALKLGAGGLGTSVFDYIHPNCMVFNSNGRLFVGDSRGHISVWDVNIRQGLISTDNFFQIRQKELEGDEINQLIVHPIYENKLFVHSRDNCIRLLEYESMKGPRIRQRFFGSKCKDLMVRSCVSPDGRYLVAGSEDGTPHVWDVSSGDAYGPKTTRNYECRFLDLVSDISWNPKYNMFALAGFGHTFPVMIYVYERSEEELNDILYHTSTAAVSSNYIQQNSSSNDMSEFKSGGLSSNMGHASQRNKGVIVDKENEHIGKVNNSRGTRSHMRGASQDLLKGNNIDNTKQQLRFEDGELPQKTRKKWNVSRRDEF